MHEDYYLFYAIEEDYPKENQWKEIPEGFSREGDVEYDAKNFLLSVGTEKEEIYWLNNSYIWLKRSTGEVDKFLIWIEWDFEATLYRR